MPRRSKVSHRPAARGGVGYAGGALSAVCQKTKLCMFYEQGHCARGHACAFAHGQDELRSVPDLSRTKLCPSLVKHGYCRKGADCRHAHSSTELRPVDEALTPTAESADDEEGTTPSAAVSMEEWERQPDGKYRSSIAMSQKSTDESDCDDSVGSVGRSRLFSDDDVKTQDTNFIHVLDDQSAHEASDGDHSETMGEMDQEQGSFPNAGRAPFQLIVRNTFIHAVMENTTSTQAMRRVSSASGRLGLARCFED